VLPASILLLDMLIASCELSSVHSIILCLCMVTVCCVLVSDPFKSMKTNQPAADPFSSSDPFSAAFSSKSSVSTAPSKCKNARYFAHHLILSP
jgi:hypothetical protein